jgi:hypothetical protein
VISAVLLVMFGTMVGLSSYRADNDERPRIWGCTVVEI